jgi:hypothetical protein
MAGCVGRIGDDGESGWAANDWRYTLIRAGNQSYLDRAPGAPDSHADASIDCHPPGSGRAHTNPPGEKRAIACGILVPNSITDPTHAYANVAHRHSSACVTHSHAISHCHVHTFARTRCHSLA